MYEIEKDVPRPQRGSTLRKYPFAGMEIGDSFFAPLGKFKTLESLRAGIYQCIRLSRRGTRVPANWKFTIHTEKENNGVRCWRIE